MPFIFISMDDSLMIHFPNLFISHGVFAIIIPLINMINMVKIIHMID